MSVQQAYNAWAGQYDTNENKTRDLEAIALRETLAELPFDHCLEIGCGTGKNTVWLMEKAKQVTAVDLSEEMLAIAKAKIVSDKVIFQQADITKPWGFGSAQYDIITFSLMLEHIENLEPVFKEAATALQPGGHIYIGELHPFKQYAGSQARFETVDGVQVVDCFNHHLSDFTNAGKANGFDIVRIQEYFDNGERKELPRLLVVVLRKR